jgi:hypothetical protein
MSTLLQISHVIFLFVFLKNVFFFNYSQGASINLGSRNSLRYAEIVKLPFLIIVFSISYAQIVKLMFYSHHSQYYPLKL